MNQQDLSPRLDVRKMLVVLIDASSSMKDCCDTLQACGADFIRRLQADRDLSTSVDILILRFNLRFDADAVFQPISEVDPETAFQIQPYGATDTGLAIARACELIEAQKQAYKKSSTPYQQPIVFLFTDGVPDAGQGATDSEIASVKDHYAAAAARIQDLERANKMIFVGVGVGYADEEKIRELTSGDFVYDLRSGDKTTDFTRFFALLYDGTKYGTPLDAMFDSELLL